jgi:hypothetical protein
MKWDDDSNKYLKYHILDLLIFGLGADDAANISIKTLTDSIDEMFEKLLENQETE